MSSTVKSEFGPLRSCIWPIHKYEIRKIVPMLLMLFLIVFSYDLLRNMKDAVVITAAGAAVLPFIKIWALLPGAILLTLLFAKLSNRYSQDKVFYFLISGFLAFFIFFAFLLYPLREALHAHALANYLERFLPVGLKGMVTMLRYWSFTLFYVMSELWGTMVMTVLFWGFANEVTRMTEARRFYGVLCIGANFAAILAGRVAQFLPDEGMQAGSAQQEWGASLSILVSLITVCGLGAMLIFRWMNHNVLNDPSFDDLHSNKKDLKAKGKLSIKESFSYLSKSNYLICIAILVLAYNLSIHMVEVIWKDQVGLLYPSPADYYAYMSDITSWIGVISLTVAIFMTTIISRLGWTRTALITPIIMLITSAGFFTFYLWQDYLGPMVQVLIGTTPLAVAVFFGAAQNILSKAMKYSVFDATKEIAFIPLDHECKLKGKAAIDGVGSRLGKSSGSFIHTGFLMIFGSLTGSAPYVAGIILGGITCWIIATRSLGKQFHALVHGEKDEPQAKLPPKLPPTDSELAQASV